MYPPSLQKLSRAMFPASPRRTGARRSSYEYPKPCIRFCTRAQLRPESARSQAHPGQATRGRIYTPLPRMWVGMGLAVLCALFQRAGGVSKGGVLLVSIIGTCYWLFCIYRSHKVLAEYTGSKYPISPRKALGFQIIPIFQYYWFFRWTRQLAKFVDAESGEARMPRVWPGLLMSLSSLLGWNPAFKSLRLFLIFALGIYFTRKLRQVLPACEPVALERWHRWNLSMSAGVGAAFGFVLFRAIHYYVHVQYVGQLH